MKLTKWIALSLVIITIFAIILYNLKSDTMIVKASYLMLACEKCDHMKVEDASAKKYVGATIIPLSRVIDIEQIIDEVSLSKQSVCLMGTAYLFNVNIFGIQPSGIRFRVTSRLPILKCTSEIDNSKNTQS